jgi:hypothetical protein
VEAAVSFAMGFEKETLLYFHSVRDVVKEKDIIDEIINEEKRNIIVAQRLQEKLHETGLSGLPPQP